MASESFFDFKPLDASGNEFPLSELRGKWVLVVNVASKCGFTDQYAGLETLYQEIGRRSGDRFAILGFPCNQFSSQEPGTNEEIQTFCRMKYGVTFPVLAKVEVNGDGAHPLYRWLKSEKAGLLGLQMIKWNFEKFLVSPEGQVKARWASTTKPDALAGPIAKEMGLAEDGASAAVKKAEDAAQAEASADKSDK